MNKYFLIAAGAAMVSVGIVGGYLFAQEIPEKQEEIVVSDVKHEQKQESILVKTEKISEKNHEVQEKTEAISCDGSVTAKVVNEVVHVFLNGKEIASQNIEEDFAYTRVNGERIEVRVEDRVGCSVLMSIEATGKGGAIYLRGMDALLGGDLATGKMWYQKGSIAQDISQDGMLIAASTLNEAGENRILVLDAKTGKVLEEYALSNAYDEVGMPTWSQDGKQLALTVVYKWEMQKTEVIILDRASKEVTLYESSPDKILTVSDWTGKFPTVVRK